MLFTDTDSVTYEIKTEDIYEDFYKDKDLFDFSNIFRRFKVLWSFQYERYWLSERWV